MQRVGRTVPTLVAVLTLVVGAQAAFGAVVPETSAVGARQFFHPGLDVQTRLVPAAQTARAADLDAMLIPVSNAYLDTATGRWATLIPTQPLIPGDGFSNNLSWADLRVAEPADDAGIAEAAGAAFRGYVAEFSSELGLSVNEFASDLNISLQGNETILIHVPRVIDGVPVRNSFVNATINHGNLILMGSARWADMNVSPVPAISEGAARQSLDSMISDLPVNGRWGDTELILVPFEVAGSLGYRLAYSLKPSFDNEIGNYEGLVDAHSGELLLFKDTNHYATRAVVGGVHPITNDGVGADGTEQAGWPMPFADLNGGIRFTSTGGEFPGSFAGTVTTTLDGEFLRINDSCGNISESSTGANADIDLGTSGGDDCTTPVGGTTTHSARDTFYHTNRAIEWARSEVDYNWLSNVLVADVNISQSCNAFWDGRINMFRSGGGCGNTGEIAGVINHEWGHGVDDNDNNPSISFPGEGIADIYAALTLDDSCIGRAFFDNGNCSGYGDPCIDCSGIRDIDWEMRQSQTPHDAAWGEANCGGCGFFATVHCLGAVYSEAVWDLYKRDLPSNYGFDNNHALALTSRLTLVGAGNVGDWFTCNGNGQDGCAGQSGYMNYLAADDTDGNMNNGTPHMNAIFDAFDRHGIACSTPVVSDAGCAGAPTQAPVVTATVGDQQVTLNWNSVANATHYIVYRGEGVKQCDIGKVIAGVVRAPATSFTDTDLHNDFDYYYTVSAAAIDKNCAGPHSTCTAATPN